MAYRGEDLDLRTPQGWGSAGREVGAERVAAFAEQLDRHERAARAEADDAGPEPEPIA